MAEWDEPVDVAWKQEYSEKEKAMYYWNEYTGEATFGTPDKLAWSLKQELQRAVFYILFTKAWCRSSRASGMPLYEGK